MRHVFVDESSQNAHQFMVLGALVVPGMASAIFESELQTLLSAFAITAEIKWTKVSRAKYSAYQAVVDFYFDRMTSAGSEFHALVLDCRELDHGGYNQGDPDLGYNKFLYQLLYHKIGKVYGETEKIVADLDARNTTREVAELQNVLNSSMRRLHGMDRPSFVRVAHRNSKSTRLLQLTDILSGSVAWHLNDHDAVAGSSGTKAALANHIASRVNLRRLGKSSPLGEKRIDVWNFRLQPRRKGARQSRP